MHAEDWLLIEEDIDAVLRKVGSCASAEEAAPMLDDLGKIQELLARLRFKYDVPLSRRLRRLVREFDRSDDPDLRAFIFAKIKEGRFLTG